MKTKNSKKVIIMALAAVMLFSVCSPAFVACAFDMPVIQEEIEFGASEFIRGHVRKQITVADASVEVRIPSNYAEFLTDEELRSLIKDNQLEDGAAVNIERVVTINAPKSGGDLLQKILPEPIFTYKTDVRPVGGEQTMSDWFLTSVAKGQTTKIRRKFSHTEKLSASQDYYGKLGIENTVTAEVEKEETRVGPPEGSAYNSREFRIRFLGQNYNWTQTLYWLGNYHSQTSGTATSPTRYYEYSIDRYVY